MKHLLQTFYLRTSFLQCMLRAIVTRFSGAKLNIVGMLFQNMFFFFLCHLQKGVGYRLALALFLGE